MQYLIGWLTFLTISIEASFSAAVMTLALEDEYNMRSLILELEGHVYMKTNDMHVSNYV